MGNAFDMLVLLALVAGVGLWMKSSTARERAVREAHALCQRYGLQLLDETVGLRRLRLRRADGLLRFERCYDFEVSVDGRDRQSGQLCMVGTVVTHTSLPSMTTDQDQAASGTSAGLTSLPGARNNVVDLASRRAAAAPRMPQAPGR